MNCRRRTEEFGPWDHDENDKDFWREDHTCSFCGSLEPDYAIQLIKQGFKVDRTDKNYKIYLNSPDGKGNSLLPHGQSMWKVYIMHFSREKIDALNKALGLTL